MEKEVELIHKNNREIGALGEKIEGLIYKIGENHDIHLENRKDILDIKETTSELNTKVGIQNGRILKSETKIEELAKITSELATLVSRHNGELIRRNKAEEEKHLFYNSLKQSLASKILLVITVFVITAIILFIFPALEVNNILRFL